MPEIGQTLSHFRIMDKIGQGGMGEVYLADDTTLDRKVALKFLPEAFTSDPERMARFEREAKLLASLNHPNIAGIYGLEQADGNRFLVLEYVEGKTLQARLSKGALPLEDALALCRQIAEGLEAAHEKGVIHRDLKPANVMITAEEKVKILDFGLAKAFSDETQSIDSSQSPTLTEAMTQPGVILGTAAYMSPEQAKGKSVDKRADIWAFGCILYECLTGKRAFEGEAVTETLAAVIKEEPDWDTLPIITPQNLRFVLRRCLEKEKGRRFRDAADVQIEMEETRDTEARKTVIPIKRSKLAWSWAVITTILLIALAGTALHYLRDQKSGELMRFQVSVPSMPNDYSMAISPDGRSIAFVASSAGSEAMLFIRDIDSLNSRKLEGTEGASYPFWSPDSRSIGFFAKGWLRRVDVSSGPPRNICTAVDTFGGSWNHEGKIIFADSFRGPLLLVSADGGEPIPISNLDLSQEEGSHIYPYFLPDGNHYLYTIRFNQTSKNGIYVGSLDSKEKKRLLTVNSVSIYVEPGYILFQREGTLLARPLDLKTFTLKDEDVRIAENVIFNTMFGLASFSVSQNLRLIYRATETEATMQFLWFDRSGKQLGTAGEPGPYMQDFDLSPDEKFIAMRFRDSITGDTNICLLDWAGNQKNYLTHDSTRESGPRWSFDGFRIAFNAFQKPDSDIYEKKVGGIGDETILVGLPVNEYASSWSKDGQYFAYIREDGLEYDIYVIPLFGERKPIPIDQSHGSQWEPQFSSNGKWIAYMSEEFGTNQIWIISFPGGEIRRQISNKGGIIPRWRGDGKELFYLDLDGNLMAVDINVQNDLLVPGNPHILFDTKMSFQPHGIPYDATSDGQRFLLLKPLAESASTPITVVLNWTKILEQ